jgi:NADPH-dependent glutamate synthase beta subunit-like oxidoreductase
VHLCSLESLDELPADDLEIIEGDEEGVARHHSLGPKEILLNDKGRVTGVVFQRCTRVFDEQRRFAPLFDESQLETIRADTVVWGIGQRPELSFLDPEQDIRRTERGLIDCHPQTNRTSADDVFVAGDIAYGPRLLIDAVASGKRHLRDRGGGLVRPIQNVRPDGRRPGPHARR